MPTNWIKFAGVGRFIFGIAVIVGLFLLVPTLAHASPIMMVMMLVTITPLTFLIYPITIASVYFIFTSKFRWRIDVVALVVIVAGLYGVYQFANPPSTGNIIGNTALNVTVLTELRKPVTDLEVYLGEQPGQPPQGGTAKTNAQGVAGFNVKPGDYVIYFSTGNFPQNLEYPQNGQQVHVEEGKINQATVVLKSK